MEIIQALLLGSAIFALTCFALVGLATAGIILSVLLKLFYPRRHSK